MSERCSAATGGCRFDPAVVATPVLHAAHRHGIKPMDGRAFANALLALALDFPEHSKSYRDSHHYSDRRERSD